MKINSAQFVKGVIGTDDIFEDGTPQIAFIGRSNVGKSSIINSVTGEKSLAKTSSFPGSTQQINIFLVNKAFYLVDLPGYGYAKSSREGREQITKMINWYLFMSGYDQRVVLIVDAKVGVTRDDLDMLHALEEYKKEVIVVANKVDKVKKADYEKQLQKITEAVGHHMVIPYSSVSNVGLVELTDAMLR